MRFNIILDLKAITNHRVTCVYCSTAIWQFRGIARSDGSGRTRTNRLLQDSSFRQCIWNWLLNASQNFVFSHSHSVSAAVPSGVRFPVPFKYRIARRNNIMFIFTRNLQESNLRNLLTNPIFLEIVYIHCHRQLELCMYVGRGSF